MPKRKTTLLSGFVTVGLAGFLFFVDSGSTSAAPRRARATAGARSSTTGARATRARGRLPAKSAGAGRNRYSGPGYRLGQRPLVVAGGVPRVVGPATVVVPSSDVQPRVLPAAAVGDDHQQVSPRVVRVIDGQTLLVAAGERRWRVRLLGVDVATADESYTDLQEAAKVHLAELVEGQRISLTYDELVAREDADGVTVAYVHRGGDNAFVNRRMIRDGYGLAATGYDHQLSAIFAGQQRRAEEAKAGIWTHVEPAGG